MRKTPRIRKNRFFVSPNASLYAFSALLLVMLVGCLLFWNLSDRKTAGVAVTADAEQTDDVPTEEEGEWDDGAWEGETADVPVFLSRGDRGHAVTAVQDDLRILGYDPGDKTGIYTLATASAVKRFQEDMGLNADGICTGAVSAALSYFAKGETMIMEGEENSESLSEPLRTALTTAGCLAADNAVCDGIVTDGTLRDALILFQRTHGLCATGNADFATRCALGLFTPETICDAASAAVYDLRVMMLVGALDGIRRACPEADDLCTLTACAEILLTDADALAAVCAALGAFDSVVPMDDGILRRAAEDAICNVENGAMLSGVVESLLPGF